MKVREASRLGKNSDLGRRSKFTPIILLDSWDDFKNLHQSKEIVGKKWLISSVRVRGGFQ